LHFEATTGRIEVLRNVSLEIARGEIHCIIGPTGCGKSTLLNLMAGLLRPDTGTIKIDGRQVGTPKSTIGYMTQKDTLLPWFTCRRNVQLPNEAVGRGRDSGARASELLELVGLHGFEDYYPGQLSGGMRKRVQLARMLAQEPSVLLMDEPFGGLDYQTKVLIHEHFLNIWEARRSTVVFVTHDLNEAIGLADRITMMTKRPAQNKADFTVGIPRPRRIELLIDDDVFRNLHHELWRLLRIEIQEQGIVDGVAQ